MIGAALQAHLDSGATTLCRAWTVQRRDGMVLGFTDHDRDLVVEGVTCRADTGLTARALQQTTGLAVDNSEAVGALSDVAVTEADILAGRFDGAVVRSYLVNWAAPEQWVVQFHGSFGEITRVGGAFRAELRGLSEAMNQPQGHVYDPGCSAVLGDSRCRFDSSAPGYQVQGLIEMPFQGSEVVLTGLAAYADRWFVHGRFEMLTGAAAGLVGVVKIDRQDAEFRRVELWQALGADVAAGDSFRITAGCDKTAATCRAKFANFLNFRGFPHIPGEDWLTAAPAVTASPDSGGGLTGLFG